MVKQRRLSQAIIALNKKQASGRHRNETRKQGQIEEAKLECVFLNVEIRRNEEASSVLLVEPRRSTS